MSGDYWEEDDYNSYDDTEIPQDNKTDWGCLAVIIGVIIIVMLLIWILGPSKGGGISIWIASFIGIVFKLKDDEHPTTASIALTIAFGILLAYAGYCLFTA